MNKKQYLQLLREYRAHRRSKDWVRSWFFTSDESCPYIQFIRLNPEE
jgi:hypothetical protein